MIREKATPETVRVGDDQVATIVTKLDRMDARSAHGAWTCRVLALIREHPATVSTELARCLDRPRAQFKADVRKLKALGLTESLEVGYRLTPLGEQVLDASG